MFRAKKYDAIPDGCNTVTLLSLLPYVRRLTILPVEKRFDKNGHNILDENLDCFPDTSKILWSQKFSLDLASFFVQPPDIS